MPDELADLPSACDVPDADRAVITAGYDLAVICPEQRLVDDPWMRQRSGMAIEAAEHSSDLEIPDPDALVPAARCRPASIGRNGHAFDRVEMPGKRPLQAGRTRFRRGHGCCLW